MAAAATLVAAVTGTDSDDFPGRDVYNLLDSDTGRSEAEADKDQEVSGLREQTAMHAMFFTQSPTVLL